MSKICQNCGNPLADEMRFCQNCGAPYQEPVAPPQPQFQQAPQYQMPPQYQPQPQQPAAPKAPKAPKKANFDVTKIINSVKTFANGVVNRCKTDKKFMGICIGIAAGFLAVVVLLCVLLFSGGYTKPIDLYIDMTFEGKSSAIKKMAPADYWEWYEDEYDEDVNDIIEEYEEDVEDMLEYLEDEYGKNFRVTYKVTKKKALSDKKLEGIAEALADKYDLDEKKFTAGYDLELEVSIKGSEDDEEDEVDMSVIKYKGNWYLISWSKSGDEYYASFYID